MPIIDCPDCGNTVSEKADVCIHCGFPLREYLVSQNYRDFPTLCDIPRELLVSWRSRLLQKEKQQPLIGVASSNRENENNLLAQIGNGIYCDVGDTIRFGSYYQSKDSPNTKQPIEWIVLDKKNGKVLIISKHVLEILPFNRSWYAVTWERCTLRQWLNETFLYKAFDTKERSRIADSFVSSDKNTKASFYNGNSTLDRMFLLSIKEANFFFRTDVDRQCGTTEFVKEQLVKTDDTSKTVSCDAAHWWWLRSTGHFPDEAAFVNENGVINQEGFRVSYLFGGVRPAMWLKVDS